MANDKDRRLNARSDINWPIEIELPDRKMEGKVKNISSFGACISCTTMPDPGESVNIILKPHDHLDIRVTAEVI